MSFLTPDFWLTITWLLTPAPVAPQTSPNACLSVMEPVARWNLPLAFQEVSGLAVTRDGMIWIHDDERANLGILDPATGEVVGQTAFGRIPLPGDFEGVAETGGSVYLVTSGGDLVRGALPIGTDLPASLEFERARTDLGRECEIEGLGHDATPGVLLIACKRPKKSLEGRVVLFRWNIASGRLATPDRIDLRSADLDERQFRTSGVARDPESGQLVLISSRDNRLAVIASDGEVFGTRRLGKRHPQPEGVAWLSSGLLVIADEGAPGPGTITIYRCSL